MVGVLVLVDHHVLELLLPLLADVGHVLEQLDGVPEQVVEVHRAGLREAPLVAGVHVGHRLVEEARHLGRELLGPDQPVLGVGDAGLDAARRIALRILVELVLEHVLDDPDLVGLVVDREAGPEPDAVGLGPQDAGAGGVERHHPHAAAAGAEQAVDALQHLLRGPVGEGDREDLPGRDAVIAHEVRDPVGEHARLAGAGARDDQHGALDGLDCSALLGVQLVEETLRHRDLQGTSETPCSPRLSPASRAGRGARRDRCRRST